MLTLTTLKTQIAQSIRDSAAGRVSNDQIEAAIVRACDQLSKDAPNRISAMLTLIAGSGTYPAPDDCFVWLCSTYADHRPVVSPFASPGLGRPILSGGTFLFDPMPTDAQLESYGDQYHYQYGTRYQVADDDAANVPDTHAQAVFLLAMALLMLELSSTDIIEPMALHKGLGEMQQPRTAADMHRTLMKAYGNEVKRIND